MREVVLWTGMSRDGFTSAANEQLDWLVPYATRPQAKAIFRRLRERCDTVLVGRANYEGFLSYSPKVKQDPEETHGGPEWADGLPSPFGKGGTQWVA